MIILVDEDGQISIADGTEELDPRCWPTAVKVEVDSDGAIVAFKRSISDTWEEVIK